MSSDNPHAYVTMQRPIEIGDLRHPLVIWVALTRLHDPLDRLSGHLGREQEGGES